MRTSCALGVGPLLVLYQADNAIAKSATDVIVAPMLRYAGVGFTVRSLASDPSPTAAAFGEKNEELCKCLRYQIMRTMLLCTAIRPEYSE